MPPQSNTYQNPYLRLRNQNIFDPNTVGNDLPSQGGITGHMPFDLTQGPPSDDPYDRPYRQIDFGGSNPIMAPQQGAEDFDPMSGYTAEHAAIDRYNQLNAAFPAYQKPGKLRRIGGAILGSLADLGTNIGGNKGGISGIDTYNEMVGRNQYKRDIEDWKTKIAPAGQAANLERYANANERQVQYQAGQQRIAQGRLNETERKNQEQAGFTRTRLAADEWKRQNPNHHFTVGKDGNLYATDPVTLQKTNLGKTGMSDVEASMLTNQNKMQQIQAGGEVQEHLANVRGDIQSNLQDQRAWAPYDRTMPDGTKETWLYNTITGQRKPWDEPGGGQLTKPGTTPGPLSGTQEKAARALKAKEVIDTRPDLKDYLQFRNGEYFIKENDGWGERQRAAKQKKIDELKRILYPEGSAPAGQGERPKGEVPKQILSKQQRDAHGNIRTVYSTDGVKWYVGTGQ
jgi:hypothetical protein